MSEYQVKGCSNTRYALPLARLAACGSAAPARLRSLGGCGPPALRSASRACVVPQGPSRGAPAPLAYPLGGSPRSRSRASGPPHKGVLACFAALRFLPLSGAAAPLRCARPVGGGSPALLRPAFPLAPRLRRSPTCAPLRGSAGSRSRRLRLGRPLAAVGSLCGRPCSLRACPCAARRPPGPPAGPLGLRFALLRFGRPSLALRLAPAGFGSAGLRPGGPAAVAAVPLPSAPGPWLLACFARCAVLRWGFPGGAADPRDTSFDALEPCLPGSPLRPSRPRRPRWGLRGSAWLFHRGLRAPAVPAAPPGLSCSLSAVRPPIVAAGQGPGLAAAPPLPCAAPWELPQGRKE